MRTYHRNFIFESSDFDNLCRFIIQDNAINKDNFIWHIGRMVDWKYNIFNKKKHIPDNFNRAAQLWFNYLHELIGFVINEDFTEEFTVFLNDKYSFLYPEMLQWVKENWGRQYNKLRTSVTENQTLLMDTLKKQGYILNDWFEMKRVFDTSNFKDYTIDDPTVTFQSMSRNGDYKEHRVLRRSAWPKVAEDEMDQQIEEYIRRSPIYNSDFDFVLVNQDGHYVSGCEAFLDYENKTAEIERVCTHSEFYNKGYSQMTLKTCMRRLYENNITTAYITGGYDKTIYLYGKLGHIAEVKRSFYEIELEG